MVKRGAKRSAKRMRGGSAWEYTMKTVGNMQEQLANTFGKAGSMSGNEIVKIGAPHHKPFLGPSLKGGRRRHRKTKRGGMWGTIYNAVVPAALFGLQQGVRRKHNKTVRSH